MRHGGGKEPFGRKVLKGVVGALPLTVLLVMVAQLGSELLRLSDHRGEVLSADYGDLSGGLDKRQSRAVETRSLVTVSTTPPVQPERIVLYLAREMNHSVEVRITPINSGLWDVLSAKLMPWETASQAAERVLYEKTGLRGPPEVEFLVEVSGDDGKGRSGSGMLDGSGWGSSLGLGASGAPDGKGAALATFVALVRMDRWRLRGRLREGSGGAEVRVHSVRDDGRAPFVAPEQVQEFLRIEDVRSNAALGASGKPAFEPWVAATVGAAAKYLEPWVLTAGKKDANCR